jgi:hypothetical protein
MISDSGELSHIGTGIPIKSTKQAITKAIAKNNNIDLVLFFIG